ncbi:MAG: DUF4474 domain-containing protein [Oscillospiraceae bacterium]|jgi:hypothetical protein|nr:DUF4474 domain-containing protein [Oscillospiraceae bacterium]
MSFTGKSLQRLLSGGLAVCVAALTLSGLSGAAAPTPSAPDTAVSVSLTAAPAANASDTLPTPTLLIRGLQTILPAASPAAEAAQLSGGQRSLQNPGGSFLLPEPGAGNALFHPDTWQAAKLMIGSVLDRFTNSDADREALGRILRFTPLLLPEDDGSLPDTLPAMDTGTYFLRILTKGMRNIYVCLRATDEATVYQFVAFYEENDGTAVYMPIGIFWDTATGEIADEAGNGIYYLGFEYDTDDFLVRTASDSWQRQLGYNVLYDLAAPLAGIRFETLRFPFSWDGKDWMVQLWKGNYTPWANGAEIGLYTKPANRLLPQYDCAELRLPMDMSLYHGDELLFTHGERPQWWLGGFQYGPHVYRPASLRLTGSIVFEDAGMLAAFFQSFEKNKPANLTGQADGLRFTFDWKAK